MQLHLLIEPLFTTAPALATFIITVVTLMSVIKQTRLVADQRNLSCLFYSNQAIDNFYHSVLAPARQHVAERASRQLQIWAPSQPIFFHQFEMGQLVGKLATVAGSSVFTHTRYRGIWLQLWWKHHKRIPITLDEQHLLELELIFLRRLETLLCEVAECSQLHYSFLTLSVLEDYVHFARQEKDYILYVLEHIGDFVPQWVPWVARFDQVLEVFDVNRFRPKT